MSQTEQHRTEISSLGEFGLIEHIRSRVNKDRQPSTILSIGDDAAVIKHHQNGNLTLVSTEIQMEGIHFELAYHPLKHLGYKIVVAAISDIIAMNALPTQLLVSLGLSNRFSVEAVYELYRGINKACETYGIDLVGGDTSASKSGLAISTTAIGTCSTEEICYRSTAKIGDILCVSGDLGASYLGLQILEREKQLYQHDPNIQPNLENAEYLIGRQLKPEARIDMLKYFSEASFLPTSMIDISDGLASDLIQVCRASNVGVILEEDQIPIHNDSKMKALDFQIDPVVCALNGGEDYELLFTADPKDLDIIRHLPDTYIIGEIRPKEEGIKLHTNADNLHEIKAPGWPSQHQD